MPDEDDSTPDDLAEVGRYAKFSHAQERGLVVAALEVPYWVIRRGSDFVLYVEPATRERVLEELAKFETEHSERRRELGRPDTVLPKLDTMPLFIAACAMSAFWAVQNLAPSPDEWIDRGDSHNRAIFAGEWWRTITALTLHGDFGHFAANFFFGLVFAGFLVPRLGGGVAWLGVVLAGTAGNALNAWFYRSEPHSTIGASTAVFGALGMLVAWESIERWRAPGSRGWWQLIIPLGGGLALLAWLGSGDENGPRMVDYMAHMWGFAAGLVLGAGLHGKRLPQRICGVVAIALPLLGWVLALRG